MNGRNSVSVLKSLRPLTLFDQIQELALQCNLPLPSDKISQRILFRIICNLI